MLNYVCANMCCRLCWQWDVRHCDTDPGATEGVFRAATSLLGCSVTSSSRTHGCDGPSVLVGMRCRPYIRATLRGARRGGGTSPRSRPERPHSSLGRRKVPGGQASPGAFRAACRAPAEVSTT